MMYDISLSIKVHSTSNAPKWNAVVDDYYERTRFSPFNDRFLHRLREHVGSKSSSHNTEVMKILLLKYQFVNYFRN